MESRKMEWIEKCHLLWFWLNMKFGNTRWRSSLGGEGLALVSYALELAHPFWGPGILSCCSVSSCFTCCSTRAVELLNSLFSFCVWLPPHPVVWAPPGQGLVLFLYLMQSRFTVGTSGLIRELANTWSERLERTMEAQGGGMFETDVVRM